MVLDAEHLGEDRGAVHSIERHGTKGGAFELAPKRREGARPPRLACHRFDRRGAEREAVERAVVAPRTVLSRPPPMNTGCCTRRKRLPSIVVPLAISSR